MKKLIVAVIAVGIMFAGGCCKKGGCSANPNDPKCDRCETDYCKYIGTRLHDEGVLAGKEVKFKDGEGKDEYTVIRSVPKSKITKWKSFDEMNPGMASKPVEVVSEEKAMKAAPKKAAPKKAQPKKAAPKKEAKKKAAPKKDAKKK